MKKILTILLCLLIPGAIVYWFFIRKPADAATTADGQFPLMIGSRGQAVAQLQTWLNTRIKAQNTNYYTSPIKPLAIDGIFGLLTLEAVQRFMNGSTTVTAQQFNTLIK